MRKLVVLSLVTCLGLVACGTKEKTVGSEAKELVKELSKLFEDVVDRFERKAGRRS